VHGLAVGTLCCETGYPGLGEPYGVASNGLNIDVFRARLKKANGGNVNAGSEATLAALRSVEVCVDRRTVRRAIERRRGSVGHHQA